MTGHFTPTITRSEATPREWLKLGVQIAGFVNSKSLRDDIIAYVGAGAGQGAAACFCPTTAEIELDLNQCFGEKVQPAWIGDFTERAVHFEWPKATGALTHEAAHARWTLWDLQKGADYARLSHRNELVIEILVCFEESRIERRAVEEWPDDVPFLRASAMEIVMSDLDLKEVENRAAFSVSRLMLLTVARRDAGVLEQRDVQDLEDLFIEFFTEDTYRQFRSLWRQAQLVNDDLGGFEVMLPFAEAWLNLLPEDSDLTDAQKALLGMLEKLLGEAADSAEVGGTADAADQEEAEAWAREATARADSAKERKEHQKISDRIFAKSTADIPDRITNSEIVSRRPPKPEERAAAVEIGRALDKARYRDRVAITSKSVMPPGRLKTREAIQGVAQTRQGRMSTAAPWERITRKHVEDPNLVVGVMVDISGSMNDAMVPMAVVAYVMAEAGHRIQAKAAQVYFGNSAFPTLKPGQRMDQVVIRSAADGTERFSEAFKALNGQLNLLDSSGARLLVICSDLCYYGGEGAQVKIWTDRCVKAGVGVLIMPFDDGANVRAKHLSPKVQVITGHIDPAKAATIIGQAAVKALQTVNASR